MDSDSTFIVNLTKFLQSLCSGCVYFEKGVEIIGHIYINVDSDSKKVDYILNEKICKNYNSVTFTSNSFLAQPAEKPTPGAGKCGTSLQSKVGRPSSARFNNAGSRVTKVGRSDDTPNPLSNNYLSDGRDDYERYDVFDSAAENDDRDKDSSSLIDDQNSTYLDQKPGTDPDVIILKVEYISNQSGCSLSGSCQNSGSGQGESQMASVYTVMLDQSPSSYAGAPVGAPSHQPDMFSGSSLEGTGDPSGSDRSTSQIASAYPVMVDQSPSSYAGAPASAPSHQADMFSCSSLEGTGDLSGSGQSTSQMASAYPVMVDQSPSSYAGAPAGAPSHQPYMFSGSSLEGTGDPSGHSLEQRSTSSSPLWPPETGCPVSECGTKCRNKCELRNNWLEKEEEIAYYNCALCPGVSSTRKSDIIKHIRCKHRDNVTA